MCFVAFHRLTANILRVYVKKQLKCQNLTTKPDVNGFFHYFEKKVIKVEYVKKTAFTQLKVEYFQKTTFTQLKIMFKKKD